VPSFRTGILPTASLSEKIVVTLVLFRFFAFKFLKYLITYTQYPGWNVAELAVPGIGILPLAEYQLNMILGMMEIRNYEKFTCPLPVNTYA
jgi:hypothetical protein